MEKRYQVFISSTFSDLEEERRFVINSVLKLNSFPSGMELFPASDLSQFDYIKKIIDESDYYILILAGKYGSLGPNGISYTEMEYDYAKGIGIPILTFIAKDLKQLKGSDLEEEQERKDKLLKFRDKASKNKLCNFYDNCEKLELLVYSSLSSEIKISPRTGWIRGDMGNNPYLLQQLEEFDELNKTLKNENDELRKRVLNDKVEDIINYNEDIGILVNVLIKKFNREEEEHSKVIDIKLISFLEMYGFKLIDGFYYSDFDNLITEYLSDFAYYNIVENVIEPEIGDNYDYSVTIEERDKFALLYQLEYLNIVKKIRNNYYKFTNAGVTIVQESILYKKIPF